MNTQTCESGVWSPAAQSICTAFQRKSNVSPATAT